MPATISTHPQHPPQRFRHATVPVIDQWFGSWHLSVQRRAYDSAELKQVYDDQAATWRRTLGVLKVEGAYEVATEMVLRQRQIAQQQGAMHILDCGCGDGAFSAAVAKASHVHVAAVDLSPKMLLRAYERLSGVGVEATYHLADCRALPFSDDTFDMIVSAHMIEHLPDPEAALSEIRRVLKPGGMIVVSITRPTWVGRWIQLAWRARPFSRQDGERLLHDQGFDSVDSLQSTGHLVFDCFSLIYVARKPYSLSVPAASS